MTSFGRLAVGQTTPKLSLSTQVWSKSRARRKMGPEDGDWLEDGDGGLEDDGGLVGDDGLVEAGDGLVEDGSGLVEDGQEEEDDEADET